MKVGIVGSREYPLLERVESFVSALATKYPDAVVVSGGARGVDRTAEQMARARGLGWISYRPERGLPAGVKLDHYTADVQLKLSEPWKVVVLDDQGSREDYDGPFESFRDAAFARNDFIVGDADIVVAFHDGRSRGTQDSIRKARRKGKTVFVYGPSGARIA